MSSCEEEPGKPTPRSTSTSTGRAYTPMTDRLCTRHTDISSLLFPHTALLKADSVPRHRPCTASSYLRKPYNCKGTSFPTCILKRFPARSPETCLFEGRALESVLRWRNWGLPDLGQRMPTTSKRIESKSSEEHSPFSAKTVRPSGLCVLVCGTLLPQADLQSLYLFVA